MNDAQRAFAILSERTDATIEQTLSGPILYIRRKMCEGGSVTDGTRLFRIEPCIIWRWLTVTQGWDTILEVDQRSYYQRPNDLADAILSAINARVPDRYRTELTPAGEQTVIPGCERNFAPGKRQLDLFG